MSIFLKGKRILVASVFMLLAVGSKAQILDYASDTSGALSSVAAFMSGSPLMRVNGAAEPSVPCAAGGFSTNQFSAVTTFDSSRPAVQVKLTPNFGYYLNITSITAQLRRSATGPDSVVYAYSTDGGLTWPYQLIKWGPYDGACGALVTTATWSVPITVGSPDSIMFRIYGLGAADTGGVLQIAQLAVNGAVVLSDGCTQPSLMSVSGILSNSATVNWAAVLGADGYNVRYRVLGDTVWTTVFSPTTSYNITGLTCNTVYEYQVQTSCTGGGTSVFTGSSLFQTHICVCPVPTGLGDSAITATTAKVYWATAASSINYNMRYKKVSDTAWVYTAITGTQVDLTGLNCGTAYEFEVQNVCTDTSAFSDSVVFNTLSCACPTPVGLYVTTVTAATARLNWPGVVGALSYDVRYRALGASAWTTYTDTANFKNISGLSCGTQYEFQVGSYCSVTSSSSYSTSDTFATTACPCPMPTGLGASSVTRTSATLSWSSVVWAAYYNFRYRASGSTVWINDSSATTSKVITGLSCGTTYEFELQSICGGLGAGSFTEPDSFTTIACIPASASSGTVAIYFNQPVNNSISSGTNAVYVNHAMADTIIAYISRAKYSIDIAQFDYEQSSDFSSIANAVNNAYIAGITVRWIYDSTQPNTGLSFLLSGISTLSSPKGAGYGNMHNKFMVIDANSINANDAIVCTGSPKWTDTALNYAYGNLIFIQDSGLAHAYDAEFNMMWGGSAATPNTAASKFGPHKTDLGRHTFGVGGNLVEVYFSPSDGTDAHIQSTIATANTDLYFGVYNFANSAEAFDVNSAHAAGVYTAGIIDQASNTGAAYSVLTGTLGSSLKDYSGAYQYGNEFLIVDPSNFCSDPQLLTGSQDWTVAANTLNDENTIIIHNSTVANEYLQSFNANFSALGGSLTTIANCSSAYVVTPAYDLMQDGNSLRVIPNPTTRSAVVTYNLSADAPVSVALFNIVGQQVAQLQPNTVQQAGKYSYSIDLPAPGIYLVRLTIGEMNFTQKVVKM